jgi:excisionase family DNA binding protein
MESTPQLYDVNAAARLLAVSPWTIRAYIRNGKLRPVRIGRLVRLEGQELERFVADGRTADGNTQSQRRMAVKDIQTRLAELGPRKAIDAGEGRRCVASGIRGGEQR